jgi:aminoglycoside phosphotransferase (APT) family kinase protein
MVLATDFQRAVIASDSFIMSRLPGRPLSQVRRSLSLSALSGVRHELGSAAARISTVEGTIFGYASAASGTQSATWREAFGRMVHNLLRDASRFRVSLPRSDQAIEALVAAGGEVLDAVKSPRLVHFDLWDGNVIIDLSGRTPRLSGLLDAERAFWGDPYAELASLALHGDIEHDPVLLGAWAERAGVPLELDTGARVRVLFAQLYLYLTQLIEPVSRGLNPVTRFLLQKRERYWLRRVLDRMARLIGSERP